MAALTQSRLTPSREGDRFRDPVKAATTIFAGSIVVLDGGYLAPGRTATGLKARGIAAASVVNAGAAGDTSCESLRRGCHLVANDGSITRANILGKAYIVDDQTVAATDGTGTRSEAGTIMDVDADGVWLKF